MTTQPSRQRGATRAKEHADAKFKKAEDIVIEADFTMLGDPKAKNREVWAVENVGDVFSGNWYVSKLRNKINASGFKAEGTLLRNASQKPQATAPTKPAAGKPNVAAGPARGAVKPAAKNPTVTQPK